MKRRTVLQGSVAGSLAMMFPGVLGKSAKPLIGFAPVPFAAGKGKMPAISADYEYQVLLRWGEPLQPGGPVFRQPLRVEDQLQQIGIGHDGMAYFALGPQRGVLALNHEYGKNPHVLGHADPQTAQEVLASQAAHGLSIVEIGEIDGAWSQHKSQYARRIHVNSPVTFSGPAAGSALLMNPADNPYQGTIANCANGQTPWNTYLTCEENFNLYFGARQAFNPDPEQQRYGFTGQGGGYGWHQFDPRFDLSNKSFVNETNRFGWVMEVDPMDPEKTPVKRTALGRFKHEGATPLEASDGRLIVYMGDDSPNEFIYRYVSDRPWRQMLQMSVSPLDEGRLYAARFLPGGRGEWLALDIRDPILQQHFDTQAAVLVNARMAATLLGASPMDRPEWIAEGADRFLYCALTNNEYRTGVSPANPKAPNPYGHIIRFRDNTLAAAREFMWETFVQAADHYEQENSFTSPDGLWADPDGRLFVETDGDQRDGLNNQLLVADTDTGELRRLLTGVPGCEITGIAMTPDRRTMFVNIQHPGNGDPSLTNFPHVPDGKTVPRDCTLALRRKDGGIVGS